MDPPQIVSTSKLCSKHASKLCGIRRTVQVIDFYLVTTLYYWLNHEYRAKEMAGQKVKLALEHSDKLIGIIHAISSVLKRPHHHPTTTNIGIKSATFLYDSRSALEAIQTPGKKSGTRDHRRDPRSYRRPRRGSTSVIWDINQCGGECRPSKTKGLGARFRHHDVLYSLSADMKGPEEAKNCLLLIKFELRVICKINRIPYKVMSTLMEKSSFWQLVQFTMNHQRYMGNISREYGRAWDSALQVRHWNSLGDNRTWFRILLYDYCNLHRHIEATSTDVKADEKVSQYGLVHFQWDPGNKERVIGGKNDSNITVYVYLSN